MDIKQRIELAHGCLINMLDPEREMLPGRGYEAAHDLGRWWDAMLRVEESIGLPMPPEIETVCLRNLERLTDNKLALLLNNPAVPVLKGQEKLNPHNFRETLLAYGGLVRHRNSSWAKEKGLRLVRAMNRGIRQDGSLDFEWLCEQSQVPMTTDVSHHELKTPDGWFDGTATTGRSLEALIWFYEATGESEAFALAERIAKHHFEHSTREDGSVHPGIIDPTNLGHDHSYLGTMRGLLLFGLLTGQTEYVDRVESAYRNGIRGKIVLESGWAGHDLGKTRFPDARGNSVTDPASTGDAAQIALWLAIRVGRRDLLDDVERYVRARLLPTQITQADLDANPTLSSRMLGAWGINSIAHAGKCLTPDVLAAVAHTLCDVQNHIVTHGLVGATVNLHAKYSDERISVDCPRADGAALLMVKVHQRITVSIRMPEWAATEGTDVGVTKERQEPKRDGNTLIFDAEEMEPGTAIRVKYPLPYRETREVMPSGFGYRFQWRGDEIVGVDPQDQPLPFYRAWK